MGRWQKPGIVLVDDKHAHVVGLGAQFQIGDDVLDHVGDVVVQVLAFGDPDIGKPPVAAAPPQPVRGYALHAN